MKNKAMFGLIAFGVIALLGVSLVAAGHGFGYKGTLTDEEKAEMKEKHEAIKDAIEDEDYAAWSSLMNERIAKMQGQITEENFEKIVAGYQDKTEFREAMQEARETGDYSKIEELKELYGFEGKGFGKGHFGGFHRNFGR